MCLSVYISHKTRRNNVRRLSATLFCTIDPSKGSVFCTDNSLCSRLTEFHFDCPKNVHKLVECSQRVQNTLCHRTVYLVPLPSCYGACRYARFRMSHLKCLHHLHARCLALSSPASCPGLLTESPAESIS